MAYKHGTISGAGLDSSVYSSRSSAIPDTYLSDQSIISSSRYLSSDYRSTQYPTIGRGSSMYMSRAEAYPNSTVESAAGGYSAGKMGASASAKAYSQSVWDGVDGWGTVSHGAKRAPEALYHPNILGTHNTIGQSEALFSTNSLTKRSRLENASHLPIYPQRPGERDCAYYMLTRTCKFGDTCKFDHPLWVPEGGIPDWKEIPIIHTSESFPERPGEPDCPYYLKTQRCKYGPNCKFNHPKYIGDSGPATGGEGGEMTETSFLPERPSEPICSFYAKTGKCRFGAQCKFHHPKDIEITSIVHEDSCTVEQSDLVSGENGAAGGDLKSVKTYVPLTPAFMHNTKGLPIRLGESDCPFYLKTGSCKYGATCRFNHPDRNSINPSVAVGGWETMIPAAGALFGVLNPAANLIQNIDHRFTQASLVLGSSIYPQRPGEMECDFYMKTGQCKFGERCKFHHPVDRLAPSLAAKQSVQHNVKLTRAGLPKREGSVACAYYMKTGTCKFGATCKFDHPPPEEAIAMALGQGSSVSASVDKEIADATGGVA